MATITDIYNAISAATQSLNKFSQTFPRAGGTVTPINNLSSTPVAVIGSNANRNSITFHNPGAGIAYVAPTTVGSSNGVLSPSSAALGGCIEVVPGDWVTLSGVVQQGWQAFVLAGSSSQPLTVMDQ